MMTHFFIAAAAVLLGSTGWFLYWKRHASKFSQSGYVPPASSWFSEFAACGFVRLLTSLTVGKVKVYGKEKAPRHGRVIFAANHQLPCDFAMLRLGAGRHLRMLTDSGQLKGIFGVLAALGGVISVNTKQECGGAAAERGCSKAVADKSFRIGFGLACVLWMLALAGFVFSLSAGSSLGAIAAVLAFLVVGSFPGSEPSLGIFPQGGLLPDDFDLKEHFRPGAIRVARESMELSGEPIKIVPVAIHYRWDPKFAGWTHRYLKGLRSMFGALRNPRYWNPIFKLKLDELSPEERTRVEQAREQLLREFAKSKVTNYGGVVMVGDAIDASTLPQDPIEAIAVIKQEVRKLLEEAKKR
jgi:1-acyl-sn-glycerol-3-phosphate acyltransferase